MEEVAKLFYGISGIFGILIAEFMRFGDVGVWIALFASAFGVFGFGMYPIALELSVILLLAIMVISLNIILIDASCHQLERAYPLEIISINILKIPAMILTNTKTCKTQVECTYPLDESIGTAMIFMSGQIQGGVLIALSQVSYKYKYKYKYTCN